MSPPKPTQALKGLENLFGTMKLDETLDEYTPRPGFGSTGRVIKVHANMYATRFKAQGKEANSVYHYDVEINPIVKVTNQKKPRALLWAVFNQLSAQITGENKQAIDASAYDMVKNMYTPVQLKVDGKVMKEGDKLDIVVGLKEDGRDEVDDKRRFKVTFQYAQTIDLNTITEFCRGEKQTEKTKETMLVAIQAINVLFRQDPTHRFTAVGAQGRRFFGTAGAHPIVSGGVIYNGFIQSFRWTQSGLPAVQLDTAYSAFVKSGNLVDVAAEIVGFSGGGRSGAQTGPPSGGSRGAPSGGSRGAPAGGGRGAPAGGGRGAPAGGGRGPPAGGGRGPPAAEGGRGPPGRGGGGGTGSGLQQLDPRQMRKLNALLRNAKFNVTHRQTSRVFTMRGLSTQPASDLKFLLSGRDGQPDRMVSVVEYYKTQYNVTVTKPRLPCVSYGQKNYVPMEFVKLAEFNSIPMLQLTGDQQAEMIRVAAKNPTDRAAKIREWRNTLNWDNLPKVKAWGVEVNKQMMELNARVLQPPQITYGQGKQLRAQYGTWNLKGVRFTKAGNILKSWAILSLDLKVTLPIMNKFCDQLCRVLQQANCPVANTKPVMLQQNPDEGGPYQGIKKGLQNAARETYMAYKTDPQLIVIILPRKELFMYSEVKKIAAEGLKNPVTTQCMQAQKLLQDKPLDQYLGNLSMKIHAKMGGITHEVPMPNVLDHTTMMFGADVTHPPAKGGPIPPSIAVVVGATSGDNNKFIPGIRLQGGRQEIIADLANMVYDQLKVFQRNSKALPQRLIMFRDGVSEGQWGQCVANELKAMREACSRFEAATPKYKPKITFVVCAKRHNMRFFAASDQDKDRTGNLPAGTVVDSKVTHPYAFDFYLQAHAGLQGTAKPTHYIVVSDENNFNADKMQNLCNSLCYSYARATRAVSIVPVAYYADLIATKCRDFVYTDDESAAPSVSSGSGGMQNMEFDPLKLKKRIEDHADFNSVGWYM